MHEHTYKYVLLIGLQTPVRNSFYYIKAFITVSPQRIQSALTNMSGCSVLNLLPVLPSTTFRLFNLFRLTEFSLVIHFVSVRTNEYERLIGLQTLVRTSYYNF
ncbi:hypothetical protein T07_4615 [Trichinella nelsoni]|uniref:Uncharacterized protein n=1 Tax=Trichinella nelsoni TaxID=6336 RepID=A0A0V0RDB6_9BILA|nr:hypothetical protein T07_4615 [Trichinella nelsoni]